MELSNSVDAIEAELGVRDKLYRINNGSMRNTSNSISNLNSNNRESNTSTDTNTNSNATRNSKINSGLSPVKMESKIVGHQMFALNGESSASRRVLHRFILTLIQTNPKYHQASPTRTYT